MTQWFVLCKANQILTRKIQRNTGNQADNNKKVFIDYANMARLSPVSYFPQSTGIIIASLCTQHIWLLLLAGKIVTLLFYTLLGYYSIKSIPFLKWACVFLLLCPMSLSLGASISADAVLISVSVLYISKIFQYSFDTQQKINNKQTCIIEPACGVTGFEQSRVF